LARSKILLKVRAHISNLLFLGDSLSKYRNKFGSYGKRRDRADFQVGGFSFTLKKTPIGRKLWQKRKPYLEGKITAILETECDEDRIDEIKEIIENLCWIMTFAYGSRVTCPKVAYFKRKMAFRVDSIGRQYHLDYKYPVIPTTFPDLPVKNFLESVYNGFVRERDRYNLKVLFELHSLSRTAHFIEVKFLVACILMESLKYHYCKNVKHFRQKGDYFYNHAGEKLTFHKILSLISKDLKLDIDKSFVDLRHKIIHQGVMDDPSVDLSKEWRKLMDQINHIILKILGYSGRCFSFEKNFRIRIV
jgi:hypothetical protein